MRDIKPPTYYTQNMSFANLIAAVNTRMTEALERLKAKIIAALPEDAIEELGEINVASFVKKAMKGLEEEIKENMPKDSPKKEKVEKTKKDKNAPKGAKNAYILFCADNRDQVKEENSEMKATEIISELARRWKEADEDVKGEYQEKAAEDKKRYKEEMSDYVPSDEESPKKGAKGSAKKSKKDKNAPKGAKNAYILFCADNRDQVKEENSEMKATEIISELARLWKDADEDVKGEYQEKAAEDKKRYESEMEDYVPSEEESKGKKGKGSKGKKAADSPKRPLGSYMLFAKEYRDTAKSSHPEAKATEISKILGAWWKEADEDVKKEYKDKAQVALDKFNGKVEKVEVASPKEEESKKVESKKVESPKEVESKKVESKVASPKEVESKKVEKGKKSKK